MKGCIKISAYMVILMTILIGWLGVDSHSPCSAYLMSDSRFTWGGTPPGYGYEVNCRSICSKTIFDFIEQSLFFGNNKCELSKATIWEIV